MKRVVFLIAFMFGVTSANAQMFAGYDEFCGVRVVVVPTPQMAVAARDAAGPIIYVDPGVLHNWTASRVFALAHECGHHKMGHSTPQGEWFRHTEYWATRAQELQADCWAARALRDHGYHEDLRRAIRQFANEGPMMHGTYPSGWERASHIAACANINLDNVLSPHHLQQNYATHCVTHFGTCQMGVQVVRGSSCFCPTINGPISGVAQ